MMERSEAFMRILNIQQYVFRGFTSDIICFADLLKVKLQLWIFSENKTVWIQKVEIDILHKAS